MNNNQTIKEINAMSIKIYRDYLKSENEDKIKSIETIYKTTDKATLNYLRNHNPNIPYSINTVHLQNPYKQPFRLEGYATEENFKVRPTSFKVIMFNVIIN